MARFSPLALAAALPLLLAGSAGGGQPGGRCAPSHSTPARLYLASYQHMRIVNVARGRAWTVRVPRSEASDYPYNIVRRGGCFVVWSYVAGHGYVVSALDSRMRARRLADRTRLFIPSSRPGRVWVMLGDRTHPWDERLRAVKEVSAGGRVTVAGVKPPGRRQPAASVGRWLLLFAPQRHSFIPWDPRTGATRRPLP